MGDPNLAAALDEISQRALDAYWKTKDLSAAVGLLRDGIERGRASSDSAILGKVKAMAYNLASFTWPGWDEPGITISPEHLKLGRVAADLNLRLAIELNRPPAKVANAHWIVGAHALAAAELDRAASAFAQYKTTATDDISREVSDGYAAIARGDDESFDRAIASLKAMNTEDSKSYVEQLTTARRVLLKP
jgi:hypothetical protein